MTIETKNYIIETPEAYFEISSDAGKLALLGWLEKLKEQNKEYVCMLPDGSALLKKEGEARITARQEEAV